MEIFTKNSAKCTIFQSTICNKFSSLMYWNEDIFIDVTEYGHIKILELADRKKVLDWYSRDILVDAAARNNWELPIGLSSQKGTKPV
jgi:hypothetical protein